MLSMLRPLALISALLLVSACDETENGPTAPAVNVSEAQVNALAKSVLRDLQSPSFRENREYCGVIGVDSAGVLRAAAPTRGRSKLCVTFNVPETWQIVAIYHTHGGYDLNAHSEVPSVQDIQSVSANGLLGYVSTPGGRFWSFSGINQTATLLCGPGCLPADPRYRQDRPVKTFYTMDELSVRQQTLRYEAEDQTHRGGLRVHRIAPLAVPAHIVMAG